MKRKGTVWITMGLLLIAAALFLTGRNVVGSLRAGAEADRIISQLAEQTLAVPPATSQEAADVLSEVEIPDYLLDPNVDMPVETVEGNEYIGILDIPALGRKLPVMSGWSYPKLKIAPCRYDGSAYTNDLIIAAHNYASHFGQLKDLHIGDAVSFTDVDGNIFCYEVAELETLMPTAVEEMFSGDWDLTLFTCTIGGQSRITVRCRQTG